MLRCSTSGEQSCTIAQAAAWPITRHEQTLPMTSLEKQISDFLVRYRYFLLSIAAVLTVATWLFAPPMKFDRSIESMFRGDDQVLLDFRELKRLFQGEEILMVAYRDAHLLDTDRSGIRRLELIGQRLKKVAGVKDIVSLAEIDRSIGGRSAEQQPIGENTKPYRGIADPQHPFVQRLLKLFAGYTHSQDASIAAVVCILDEQLSGSEEANASTEAVIDRIRLVLAQLESESNEQTKMMLIGEPVMIADSFKMIEEDGVRLRWTSSILLMLTIFVFFRSVRWMLIPVVVVQFALLLTQASLSISNLRLTMVSSMLNAIVTVIGVATTVHIIVIYRQARRSGVDRKQAIRQTLAILIIPIFWAIATDTAGFMSLWFSQLGPVRDFAIMMATGSLMVFVATLLIVPGLSLLPLPRSLSFLDNDPLVDRERSFLDEHLQRPLSLARKNPMAMTLAIGLFSALLSWGVFYNEVESDFTKNFRSESEIAKSYRFVENNLGGAGVWDLVIPSPAKLNYDYLKRVNRLENRLRNEIDIEVNGIPEPGITKAISLIDVVQSTSFTDFDRLPFGRDQAIELNLSLLRLGMPGYYAALHATDPEQSDRSYLRIMLRSKERCSTEQKDQVIAGVRRICEEELRDSPYGNQPVIVTGYYVMIANMIDSVIRDQWLTFSIAIGCIFLMLLIATRSWRYALIALVPNVVPILMVLGTMGWLNQKVNIGVAMIAAVSVGLSVDSSIHYILAFQRALKTGDNFNDSMDDVQNRVGRALVFSTLAIILGFSTLCISNFIPIVYFGVLSIMAMVGGLLGNLVVLPLLMQMFVKPAVSKGIPTSQSAATKHQSI
jgi:predicted RND superfamily exporter protein